MLVVYSALAILLAITHFIVRWRSRKADAAYLTRRTEITEVSDKITDLNKSKHTPADQAHLNLRLLKAMDKAEDAEDCWAKWSKRDDRLTAVRGWLHGWLGKGFGYVCGVTDAAAGTMYAVPTALGIDHDSAFQWVFHAVRFWGQP